MNILLTGNEGFIGSHLFSHLKKENNVIGLDIKNNNDILSCDLPINIDLVIHLAGLSGVRDSLTKPTEYWKTNVIGGQRLFDFYKDTRIIYASSSTAWEPWRNPYAMSKYSLEQLYHSNSLGLRFTTVYGPGAKNNMLIPLILKNKLHYLNVNHIRDFIHIDDVVRAISKCFNNKKVIGNIINIGSGKPKKVSQVIRFIHKKIKTGYPQFGKIKLRKDEILLYKN